MTTEEFKKILDKGETDTVEFKSWVKARSQKEIISLAVDELIAFANHKGGTVYFGVEDQSIEVTGCSRDYDSQRIIEGIYDKTRPPLFTEIYDFEYEGKLVIAVYVKQYPDRIVIENPGGFLDGITENNIITHPSVPRNKLIAETLQNLKYVQRTGQGVDIIFKEMVSMGKPYPKYKSFNDAVSLTIFSTIDHTEFIKFVTEVQEKNSRIMPLAEMMILRDLMDNRKEPLSVLACTIQKSLDETKRSCNELINDGLIEIVGKEYMLTAKVYEALKSDVEYTRDKTIQYIKAKNMILEYLQSNKSNSRITSAKIQEMCGFTKQQARGVIDKMRGEGLLKIHNHGKKSYYEKL